MRFTMVSGLGGYVPERVLSNAELAGQLGITEEWIVERTGIRERRVAAPHESASDMAIRAGREALDHAKINPADIDLTVVCTVTPDMVMPSTACLVQAALGIHGSACFDLHAACSGFVYGLHVVRGMVESGLCRHALLIGVDKMTDLVDTADRNTRILFGDGAGAVVLSASDNPDGGRILSSVCRSDGRKAHLIQVPVGGSREPLTAANISANRHYMHMEGREVFKMALTSMHSAVVEALEQAQLPLEKVDHLIPHQSNARIVEALADRMGLGKERLVSTIERHGNTSAASIPLAWYEAVSSGRIQRGHTLALAGVGAGMTWGSAVIRF